MCFTLKTEMQSRIHFQLEHWVLTSRKFFNGRKEYNFFGFFSLFLKNRGFCHLTEFVSHVLLFSGLAQQAPADPTPSSAVLATNGRWQDTVGGRFFWREELQIVKRNCGCCHK